MALQHNDDDGSTTEVMFPIPFAPRCKGLYTNSTINSIQGVWCSGEQLILAWLPKMNGEI